MSIKDILESENVRKKRIEYIITLLDRLSDEHLKELMILLNNYVEYSLKKDFQEAIKEEVKK